MAFGFFPSRCSLEDLHQHIAEWQGYIDRSEKHATWTFWPAIATAIILGLLDLLGTAWIAVPIWLGAMALGATLDKQRYEGELERLREEAYNREFPDD